MALILLQAAYSSVSWVLPRAVRGARERTCGGQAGKRAGRSDGLGRESKQDAVASKLSPVQH